MRNPLRPTDSQLEHVNALRAFDEGARRLSLPYILIKGFALSVLAYGSPFERVSSDIDILVSHDDLAKADYVARTAGFKQPRETFRARQLSTIGALNGDILNGMASPFCLRTNPSASHVAPYYYFSGSGHAVLEIHDRFHCLSPEDTGALLWSPKIVNIQELTVPTCSDEAAVVLLLLSIHDDAETIRGNFGRTTFSRRGIGDLHEIVHSRSSSNQLFRKAHELIEQFGVVAQCGVALSDYLEIYPQDSKNTAILTYPRASVWRASYTERLNNVGRRKQNAIEIIRESIDAYRKMSAFHHDTRRWTRLQTCQGELNTNFAWRLTEVGQTPEIEWIIPKSFERLYGSMVLLTTGLVSDRPDETFGWRLRIFRSNHGWEARVETITTDNFDEHASKRGRGNAIRVDARQDKDSIVLTAALHNRAVACLVFSSMHVRQISAHYHPVAGKTLSDVLANVLGEQA